MKTMVMTGGTSGIGLVAATLIRDDHDVRLILGARQAAPSGVESLPLDLQRLASVRDFAAAIEDRLGEAKIDALVLNAGTQFGDTRQRTENGYEPAFAVNHLAHYLLLRQLMPRLAVGALVVITTSNLHDPMINTIAPPEHADATKLALGQVTVDQGSDDPRAPLRAYAASKLCNLLTAQSLASSAFACERRLRVIAFNPGFTPGTGLTRNHALAFRLFFSVWAPVIGFFQRANTVSGGGQLLAKLVLSQIAPPAGRLYASQVKRRLTWPDPAKLATDEAVKAKLWRDSAALVGLSAAA